MNFVFYLLGRAHRTSFHRPTPRQAVIAAAAAHASRGNTQEALRLYRRLSRRSDGASGISPLDLLIRGHLHLLDGNLPAAHDDLSQGIDRLVTRAADNRAPTAPTDAPCRRATSIEHLLSQADAALRLGRYVRAAAFLHQGRSLLDTLLAAHSGLLLIDAAQSPDSQAREDFILSSIVPLAKLSDITLRLLARAHLATHLSQSLRERNLRDDLAPWAVSAPCIDTLLQNETTRLAQSARDFPAHAEFHYRLGLTARAAGHLEQAADAFTATLRLHPYHVPSAARLVSTQRQRGIALDLQPLHRAFHVPTATLQTFAAFAEAAAYPAAFDRAADRLCLLAPDEATAVATRANLAFALSELALLDASRAEWREPAHVG